MGKKWLLVLSGVLLAIGLLAGCSGGGGAPAEDTMVDDSGTGGDASTDPATEDSGTGNTDDASGGTDAETPPATE